MSDLPFVWIFINRPLDGPFLDPSFEFPTTSESSLVKKLGEELYAAKGDATSYVQIMLSYYKASKKISDKKVPPPTRTNSTTENEEIDVETIVRKNIKDELNDIELVKYATRVNNDYEGAMTSKLSNFSDARSFLLSDTLVGKYYNDLMTQFPTCHYVLATIVLLRYYMH